MLRREVTADAIDQALAGTFPASDPPAWTPGMVRPAPAAATVRPDATPTSPEAAVPAGSDGPLDAAAAPSGRTTLQALGSLLGAIAVVLLFPLAFLLLALPLALAVRGVLEAVAWLATSVW